MILRSIQIKRNLHAERDISRIQKPKRGRIGHVDVCLVLEDLVDPLLINLHPSVPDVRDAQIIRVLPIDACGWIIVDRTQTRRNSVQIDAIFHGLPFDTRFAVVAEFVVAWNVVVRFTLRQMQGFPVIDIAGVVQTHGVEEIGNVGKELESNAFDRDEFARAQRGVKIIQVLNVVLDLVVGGVVDVHRTGIIWIIGGRSAGSPPQQQVCQQVAKYMVPRPRRPKVSRRRKIKIGSCKRRGNRSGLISIDRILIIVRLVFGVLVQVVYAEVAVRGCLIRIIQEPMEPTSWRLAQGQFKPTNI